jgi:hypothetical protein
MRTLCHELIHHRQFELGTASPGMDTETRLKIEDEANAVAGRMLRMYGLRNGDIFKTSEPIPEGKVKNTSGKISNRQGRSSVGVGTFKDKDGTDRTYELNRVMIAAATSDGTNPISQNPNAPDAQSWVGTRNTFHPYTEVENEMLKQAFSHIGSTFDDLAHGDMRSQEVPGTHTQSPVTGFSGYRKKKRK